MKKKLKDLVQELKKIIDLEKQSGRFKPQVRNYITWVPKSFVYTENGIEAPSSTANYFSKKSWFRLAVFAVDKLRTHKQWKELVGDLKHKFPSKSNIESYLEQFGRFVANKIAYRYTEHVIDNDIFLFINDLTEDNAKVEIKAWLQGMILSSHRVQLDENISIRRTTKNDLETRTNDEFIGYQNSLMTTNHVILNIKEKCPLNSLIPIQDKVDFCIIAFRLFKMGSVRYSAYDIISESPLALFNSKSLPGGGLTDVALQKYILEKTELRRFRAFWKEINKRIKKFPFGRHSDEITPLKIAYDRYCWALMRNVTKEERISNTIAGLEAALVNGKEELNYRLKLNTTKILVEYGYSPEEVFSLITTGYGIRSKFVHGEKLSKKDIKNIESKYGDLKTLLNRLLECLRIVLNIVIFSDLEKEPLIGLIERSFVSESEYKKLRDTIRPLKKFLV